ncbi:alpha/beta hydrolase [Reichenbachiella agarivorans]|uniref:Alpha/beta hydrolase n=1 Tax=Reichenbachiella agarivorans TaxID=2979464 RepID=A0ABY6CK43_9BACT|nr:alpha/beta hydrolase [Reichenbachiella agarivorans]UXP30892.1 alpha/beta hydrolase [Reichenbachiella agarivorans]
MSYYFKNIGCTLLLLTICMTMNAQHHVISLWQDKIPNEKSSNLKEESTITDTQRIKNVRNPSIEVYLPSNSNSVRRAVMICPGGGYGILAYDKEGTDFAKWLNGYGIAGIVLKYRLPEDDSNKTPHLSPLMDAKQGMKIIKDSAAVWGIDADKIGVMGFSAGGHLASTLGTHFDSENRPDFMALIYPVITMQSDFTHMGSRNNLLGENPDKALVDLYSNEMQVTHNTPPTFILHSADDQAVPVENSLQFYQALNDHQVPVEMHLYPQGGHGYGFGRHNTHLSGWSLLLIDWLQQL